MKKEIRYCYGNQWMYAKKENGKFGILRILQNDRIRSLPLLCIYREESFDGSADCGGS